MAIEIPFKADIDLGEGAKSLKSLKQEFKETQKELDGLTAGSQKYVDTLKKLGKVKDDIGDLNAEIKAFNPEGKVQAFGNVIGGVASGFQAATGAAALFGGQNKDLERTLVKVQATMAFTEGIKGVVAMGDGFKVLGNIIKANPIFLIIGVVVAIGGALFALKDKVKIIGDAFDFLGEIIGSVVQAGKDFLDFLGATDFAATKTADSIIANASRIKNANNDRYDSEIAAAKRAGQATELLEIKKISDITKTNDLIIQQLRLRQKANGELSDDEKKKLDELVKENSKSYVEIQNLFDTYNDNKAVKNEAATKKANEELKKVRDDYKKHIDEIRKINQNAALEYDSDQRLLAEEEAKRISDENEAAIYAGYLANEKKKEDAKNLADFRIKQEEEVSKSKIQLEQDTLSSLQSLSDIFFTFKLNGMKKGSAEEEKVARAQFNINKSLSLAGTTMATIQGVQNALIKNPNDLTPEPLATAVRIGSAISIGLKGAASLAKIASTQFGSAGGASVAGISAPSSASAPTINPPSNSTTSINPDGSVKQNGVAVQQTVRAYVVETEITKTQKSISSIEQNAKH